MQDFQVMHLGLQEELRQLETRQAQIGEGIVEAERRIAILDEAMAWSPVAVEPFPEDAFPAVKAEDTEIEWAIR